jgi:hypothetical protein
MSKIIVIKIFIMWQVVNGIRYVLNVELSACETCADSPSNMQCRIELLEGAVDRQRTLTSSLCEPTVQVIGTN